MRFGKSQRARGGNRGGCGSGGYEITDPDWDRKRVQRIRAEYDSLAPEWREMYLRGLSEGDKHMVLHRD